MCISVLAATDEWRLKAIECGAIELVLEAMRSFPTDAPLSDYASGALKALYGDLQAGSSRVATENARARDQREHAVRAVVGAMKAHSSDVDTQLTACGTLYTLCCDQKAANALAGSLGAVQTIAAALRAFPTDSELHVSVLDALSKFADEKSNRDKICAVAGIVDLVVQSLQRFLGSSEDVLRNACFLVSQLKTGAAAFCRGDFLGVVVKAMHAHATANVLQQTALRAISAVACPSPLGAPSAACVENLEAAGVFDAVITTLRSCIAGELDARVRLHAAATLLQLTHGSAAAEDAVICAGCMEALRGPDLPVGLPELKSRLQEAARRHDTARCVHLACVRCADARSRGRMCGLPGCGLRKRADGSDPPKALLHCKCCLAATYCCALHQREHWPLHRPSCRPPGAANSS